MPSYVTTGQPPNSLFQGIIKLFDNESPASGQASIAIATNSPPSGTRPVMFTLKFNSAPTAGDYLIQGSLTEVDSDYQTLYTCTVATLQDYIDVSGIFQFYRAKCVHNNGQPITVIIRR